MTDLEILLLYGNRIEDISPLAELVNLERLDLSDNHITDIEALSELKELVWLMLDFNQISDISVLLQLTSLEQVNNNTISKYIYKSISSVKLRDWEKG